LGALCVAAPAALHGQATLEVSGRVVRVAGGDTVPVSGAGVTLHRISRLEQGAVDSARTAGEGRFRFRRAADTTAVYLVSARFAGIEYFGTPLRPPGRSGIQLLVSDTSSSAPVRLGARRVIIRPPDESGTRLVVDLFSLRNDGPDTRVSPDGGVPTWAIVLPPGAVQAEVQEGDVSPTAVRFDGDTLAVLAPIGPGEKNLMVSYRLPMGLTAPSWSAPADSFDIMVEEEGAEVTGAGLQPTEPMEVMDTRLRRWTANPPTSASPATVRFEEGTVGERRALLLVAGLTLLAAGLGVAVSWRRRSRPTGAAPQMESVDPVGALAALDSRYLGKEEEVPPAEWAEYQRERARLMYAALAGGRGRR